MAGINYARALPKRYNRAQTREGEALINLLYQVNKEIYVIK
jgi:hypothetical protein